MTKKEVKDKIINAAFYRNVIGTLTVVILIFIASWVRQISKIPEELKAIKEDVEINKKEIKSFIDGYHYMWMCDFIEGYERSQKRRVQDSIRNAEYIEAMELWKKRMNEIR